VTHGIKTIHTTAAELVMRLLIIGATGGTGLQVTSQAVERGHSVTVFVRSPQKLGPLRDRVTVRQGDPRSVAELQAILPGHDAVVSALGPPGAGPTTILRAAAIDQRPLTRRYDVDDGHLSGHSGAFASISRADVADFVLGELQHNVHVHQIVGIARGKRGQK
jgi:putative NADH-flavin reductase